MNGKLETVKGATAGRWPRPLVGLRKGQTWGGFPELKKREVPWQLDFGPPLSRAVPAAPSHPAHFLQLLTEGLLPKCPALTVLLQITLPMLYLLRISRRL